DHRVDLYALGVTAYEILAGRAPFLGTNSQQVLAAHLTQRPDPLSMHRHTVPPGIEAVVMRCLEKNPADRWQSADELLRALDSVASPSGALVATSPAGVITPGPVTPDRRTRPRFPWRRVIGLAAVVTILAGIG